MEVKRLDDELLGPWNAFVEACPEATFFHRSGWKRVLEQAFGLRTHFLCALSNGRIEGVLPLAEVRSVLFGSSLVSLPFCVYGGLAVSSESAGLALDQAAQELAQSLRVGHLEYRNLAPRHPHWPTRSGYVTFCKQIDADPDVNMEAIPRKQRRMVRQGMKAGLVSELDAGNDRFFSAYSWNVHRLGTPVFGRRYFDTVREVFGEDCQVLTVSHHGETVASVMSFFFRDQVLPYYGGGFASAREYAAYDFMYWEVMRRAAEQGCRRYDFGRSKLDSGSYSFKKNWGFEPQPLHYECKLIRARAVPQNNPQNPRYQRLIKLWQRLPLPVANILGPYLSRSLG
ncbi:MAG: FemAB family XrtA/PEP-CTERM system-associated protein [Immundisolibacter sp.]|uniref:FemAB family XrtA/PEP-CTERM system-associated protein n=1 Tax=Immundisolibacter sp. TaxID=1934948 RepID=UPI003EE21A44